MAGKMHDDGLSAEEEEGQTLSLTDLQFSGRTTSGILYMLQLRGASKRPKRRAYLRNTTPYFGPTCDVIVAP